MEKEYVKSANEIASPIESNEEGTIDNKTPVITEYTDEEGREGVFPQLMHGGQTLQEVYNNGIQLAGKIEKKWRKKRLMQIGMLDDLLGILSIATVYNRALENQIIELTQPKKEENEADQAPGTKQEKSEESKDSE